MFPQFAVPYYLDRPPTGELAFDVVPILTMAACLPTLSLFLARKDFNNLALYGLGFVVAVVYHALQLGAHNGLASTRFMGIDGAGWRTIDIFFANILLARTFGHALNVDHPLIAALPNITLPVGIVTLLTTYPGITLSLCARATAGAMLLTLVLQLGWEGRALLHQLRVQYQDRYMVAALLAMAMGIMLFAMPTYQPEQYWFYHSAWHCMMGWGYIWLYQGLMDRHWVAWRKVRGAQAAVSPAAGFAQAGAARRSRQRASAQDLYAMDALDGIATSKNTAVNGHGRTDSAGSAEALGAGLQQACKDTASTPAAKGAALRAAVATTQSEAQLDMGPQHEDMEGRGTRRRCSARRL